MNPEAPVTSTVRDMEDLLRIGRARPTLRGRPLLPTLLAPGPSWLRGQPVSGRNADRQRLRLDFGHQPAQLADHVAVQLIVVRPLQGHLDPAAAPLVHPIP